MLQTQIKQNMFLSHMIRVSSVESVEACCWGLNFFQGTEGLCPTFQTSQDKSGAVTWALNENTLRFGQPEQGWTAGREGPFQHQGVGQQL